MTSRLSVRSQQLKLWQQSSESDVLLELYKVFPLCRQIGRIWRNNVGQMVTPAGKKIRFGLPGSSDFVGWTRDGRFLAIEAKRPGLDPTPKQAEFLEAVNACGGIAFIARCGEDVLARLR